jgi:hypothetical protein
MSEQTQRPPAGVGSNPYRDAYQKGFRDGEAHARCGGETGQMPVNPKELLPGHGTFERSNVPTDGSRENECAQPGQRVGASQAKQRRPFLDTSRLVSNCLDNIDCRLLRIRDRLVGCAPTTLDGCDPCGPTLGDNIEVSLQRCSCIADKLEIIERALGL